MTQYEHACLIRGDGGEAVRAILDRICNKWTLLVVVTLEQGPVRFTDLHQQIPAISQRMLTLTLRNLERDGLLQRTVYPTVPPKVEYTATPMARELHTHLVGLTDWAERHRADVAAARRDYDRTSATPSQDQ